ncbi:MAG: urate oxidase [Linnemannia gamsii]|nr:MAG: urate oxidase [Linnemannia gamsii]
MTATTNVFLDKQEYGKDKVRLLKVHKDTKVHRVDDLTIRCLLSGAEFTTSYTEASNKRVVATDSIKNTCYILAKSSKNVDTLELFAGELANHFLNTYNWVEGAHVTIIRHRWARMIIDGKPHNHSFWRDGEETRQTDLFVKRGANGLRNVVALKSSISGLLVLKTTGSSFEDFVRDEYTTLVETKDRILSTSVDSTWEFHVPAVKTEHFASHLAQIPFNNIYDSVRDVTCKTFAEDESASVQATLYKMAAQSIQNWKWLDRVSYALPNRHFFAVDLSYFRGTKNLQEHADVYQPLADPSGLITATVARAPGSHARL